MNHSHDPNSPTVTGAPTEPQFTTPFTKELWEKDPSQEVRDGNGKVVTNISYNKLSDYPVKGFVEGIMYSWTENGVYYRGEPDRPDNLFLATTSRPQLPEGEVEHNPNNLTPTQVGDGYRLYVTSELDGRHWECTDVWEYRNSSWVTNPPDKQKMRFGYNTGMTYRVPASTPYPSPITQAVEPLEKAHDSAVDASTTEFQREISTWAAQTFPGQTPASKVEHLIEEVNELRDNPSDGEEMADCVILLFNLAEMGGFDLLEEARKKMAKNKLRKWGPPDERGVCHHIKDVAPSTEQPPTNSETRTLTAWDRYQVELAYENGALIDSCSIGFEWKRDSTPDWNWQYHDYRISQLPEPEPLNFREKAQSTDVQPTHEQLIEEAVEHRIQNGPQPMVPDNGNLNFKTQFNEAIDAKMKRKFDPEPAPTFQLGGYYLTREGKLVKVKFISEYTIDGDDGFSRWLNNGKRADSRDDTLDLLQPCIYVDAFPDVPFHLPGIAPADINRVLYEEYFRLRLRPLKMGERKPDDYQGRWPAPDYGWEHALDIGSLVKDGDRPLRCPITTPITMPEAKPVTPGESCYEEGRLARREGMPKESIVHMHEGDAEAEWERGWEEEDQRIKREAKPVEAASVDEFEDWLKRSSMPVTSTFREVAKAAWDAAREKSLARKEGVQP